MTVERKCQCCKVKFMAKSADVKRGWAKFCSKSCKAKKQEAQTHQHRDYLNRRNREPFGEHSFNDAHLFSNEEHDCNKDWPT